MAWVQPLSRKAKAAILLGVILLGVLLHNLWKRDDIAALDRSVASIYDDRLLPATYIFKLTDHLYRKRLLWSETAAPDRAASLPAELAAHDEAIATLVKDFDATYLVAEEGQALGAFKGRLAGLQELERAWLAHPTAELHGAMKAELDKALHQLGLLSQIQQHVGQDLKTGSKSVLASSTVLSELELSLLVVLCVLVHMLLLPQKPVTPFDPRHSHLN